MRVRATKADAWEMERTSYEELSVLRTTLWMVGVEGSGSGSGDTKVCLQRERVRELLYEAARRIHNYYTDRTPRLPNHGQHAKHSTAQNRTEQNRTVVTTSNHDE